MNWKTGKLIGSYELKRMFETGGMGTVYQARHLHWDMDVALKVVKEQFTQDAAFVAGFEREAETWSGLGLHPYVATCYYTQRVENTLCLCGEFVEAGSLLDWINNRTLYQAEEAGVLSRILHVSACFALGLDWAHRHGVIHRDVKPGNLLLTPDATPKVADFGLAYTAQINGLAGLGGCTPPYASPEQLAGLHQTAATDVWSWAASVIHMFTGRLCWEDGRVVPAFFAEYCALNRRLPGQPQMPESVARVLAQCLETDVRKRRSNCRELADELSSIHRQLFGEPIAFAEYGTPELEADSLNNRAVSMIEIGRVEQAAKLLDKLARALPDHYEGNINLWLLMTASGHMEWPEFKLRAASFVAGDREAMAGTMKKAEAALKPSLWGSRKRVDLHQLPFVLARPKSGAQHHHDTSRFDRLIGKAKAALAKSDVQEARRYLRMAMDLDGFANHPKLRDLAHQAGM
jgi:serine/threonine protein kinase